MRVGIPGLFNVYNALGAFGIASFLDLPKEKVEKALEHMRVNGRMELVYSSDQFSILVDYAHNAVSMESLLNTTGLRIRMRRESSQRQTVFYGRNRREAG